VGKKADVNVIDYAALRLHIPEVRYDLPMNGRRLGNELTATGTPSCPGYQLLRMASILVPFQAGLSVPAAPDRL
jgi:hypothetical protein